MAGISLTKPVAQAPAGYRTTTNAPHFDLHTDIANAIAELAAAMPRGITDLTGVDFSVLPAAGKRQLVVRRPSDGKLVIDTDLDPGSAYLATALRGAPNGIAELGADGKLEADQLPAGVGGGGGGTSSLGFRINGGAAVTRSFLNLINPTSTDHADTNTLDVDLTKADVRVLRHTTPSTGLVVTGLTTPILVPGLELFIPAGQVWDWELELVFKSTTTAKAKVVWSGSGVEGEFDGYHTDVTSATLGGMWDVVKRRTPYIDGSAGNPNGNQSFGGFSSSGTASKAKVRGAGIVKPAADTTFQIKAGVVATDSVESTVVPWASKLTMSRVA